MKFPVVTYSLIAVNVIIFVLEFLMEGSTSERTVILSWGANFAPYVLDGEWWRILTSAFLHGNTLHLAVNMLSLYVVGKELEPIVGNIYFLLLYLFCAIGAGLVSAYWNLFVTSVGASGAIFGLYGFEIILLLIANRKDSLALWRVVLTFFIFLVITFIAGQYLPFDNAGHFGGLVTGILISGLFVIMPFQVSKQFLSYLGLLAIMIMAYFSLPHYQSKYFHIFQSLIGVEEEFSEVFKAESDSIALDRLRDIRPKVLDVYNKLDSFETNVPLELQQEINEVKKLTKGRSEQVRFYITLLERESYIYHDSIEWALETYRQTNPLQFNLHMEAEQKEKPEDDNKDSENLKVVEQYYDKDWRECDITQAHYYRRGFKDSLGRWDGPVRDYYLNGGIQMKGTYSKDLRDGVFIYYSRDSLYESAGRYAEEWKIGKWEYFGETGRLQDEIRYRNRSYLINHWSDSLELQVADGDGVIMEYHTNGVIAKYEPYRNGRQDSISFGYHADGNLYYQEYFENGELLQGISYNLNGDQFRYDQSTQMTYPEGGMNKFWDYVENEKLDIIGSESLGYESQLVFNINESGEIYDIRVLSGDADSLNVIAKVILRNGPKWVPIKEHGIKPLPSEGLVTITL